MNLRYQILATVAANPGATMDEIADAIDYERKKVIYSVRDCTNKNGLLTRGRDDITGLPSYHLTDAGKQRLAQGPDNQAKANLIPKKAQPAVARNTGSDRSAPSSEAHHAEAVAVHQPSATGAATPPAEADVTHDDDATPPHADPALLAAANRMLADRLDGVAHALRGAGLQGIAHVTGREDLQLHVAALTGAYQMALADYNNAQALAAKLQTLLDSKAHECDALYAQLHQAPRAPDPDALVTARPLLGYRVSSIANLLSVFSDEAEARAHAESLIIGGTVEQANVVEVRFAAKVVRAAYWQAAEDVA